MEEKVEEEKAMVSDEEVARLREVMGRFLRVPSLGEECAAAVRGIVERLDGGPIDRATLDRLLPGWSDAVRHGP